MEQPPATAPVRPGPRRPLRRRRAIASAVAVVLVAVLVSAVVMAASAVRVTGQSMSPTLADGDRVLLQPFSTTTDVQRFEVVAIRFDGVGELLKRVIALPGDHVRITPVAGAEPRVLVQPRGTGPWYRVDNPTWTGHWTGSGGSCCEANGHSGSAGGDAVVPAGSLFLLGDDIGVSRDSRAFGWGRLSDLVGRAWLRVYPLGSFGGLDQPVRLVPAGT